MNSVCSSDRLSWEPGLLFLADSLRVLLKAPLVLLGIWVAELRSFICTLAWDLMWALGSLTLKHLILSSSVGFGVIRASGKDQVFGLFFVLNLDPYPLKCKRLPRSFRVTSAGVSGCLRVKGYTWHLTELSSYLNAGLNKYLFWFLFWLLTLGHRGGDRSFLHTNARISCAAIKRLCLACVKW